MCIGPVGIGLMSDERGLHAKLQIALAGPKGGRMLRTVLVAALGISAAPAMADEARDAFVDANVLGIFYHELGHAMIDILDLPIFGQEEDAADVASVMLIDRLYNEDYATQMIIDTADAYYAEAMQDAANGEIAFWGIHGANEQRYYNTICVFYGGAPDAREEMKTVMGLPDDRAAGCPDEYDQADYSWGAVLDKISRDAQAQNVFSLRVEEPGAPITEMVMAQEIDALNEDFDIGIDLPVVIKSCGEANAFYYPDTQSITICTEFEAELIDIFNQL